MRHPVKPVLTFKLARLTAGEIFWQARNQRGSNSDAAAQAVWDAGWAAATESVAVAAGKTPGHRAEFAARRARPIIAAVAARHGTDAETLTTFVSKGPRAETEARDEALWLLRQNNFNYAEASGVMNRKCHTAAMDAERRVEARIAERPGLRGELLALVAGESRPALRSVG